MDAGDTKWAEFLSKQLSTFEPVSEKQKLILTESRQNDLYYDVELPLSLVLGSMEYYGFRVDQGDLKEYGERLDRRIRSLEQTIYMLAAEEFNINSPKQLGIILFEKLGLKSVKKTKTGYSTDADTLNDLSDTHEIIPNILEYRQLVKLKSTYAEGLVKVINPGTGRIHSSFNQTVTSTGRISSTEPNLQNIPIRTELGREIRKAFIPADGFLFVDADYSQIELRVLAHMTGDEMLQKSFVEGADIHTQTAAQVFRVPIGEVTPEMRRSAKAVNFGIIYGIIDFSLAKDIGVTKKEAARYIDNYLSTYKSVREYMDNIVKFAQDKGYVETMFHRIRRIPELKSPNFQVRSFGKRVALNTPIQGSAADIIKIAMVKVWRELKERGLKSRLILQVHDELLVETAVDELDQVKDIVKNNMENAVPLSVPLIADVSTGTDWYEAK
jgi:DNA polymerase-1